MGSCSPLAIRRTICSLHQGNEVKLAKQLTQEQEFNPELKVKALRATDAHSHGTAGSSRLEDLSYRSNPHVCVKRSDREQCLLNCKVRG